MPASGFVDMDTPGAVGGMFRRMPFAGTGPKEMSATVTVEVATGAIARMSIGFPLAHAGPPRVPASVFVTMAADAVGGVRSIVPRGDAVPVVVPATRLVDVFTAGRRAVLQVWLAPPSPMPEPMAASSVIVAMAVRAGRGVGTAIPDPAAFPKPMAAIGAMGVRVPTLIGAARRVGALVPGTVPLVVSASRPVLMDHAAAIVMVRSIVPVPMPVVVPASRAMVMRMPTFVVAPAGVRRSVPFAVPVIVSAARPMDVRDFMPGGVHAAGRMRFVVPVPMPVPVAASDPMRVGMPRGVRAIRGMGTVAPNAVPIKVPASPTVMVAAVESRIVAVIRMRDVRPMSVPIEMAAALHMDVWVPLDVIAIVRMRTNRPIAVPIVVTAVGVMNVDRHAVVVRRRGVHGDLTAEREAEQHDQEER